MFWLDLLWDVSTPWSVVERGLQATWDDVPPQSGTHLVYEVLARSDQASTPSNFLWFVNQDVVSANYHFQRALAQDGAQSFVEGTTANANMAAGDTSVAGFYSVVRVLFPWFRDTRRAKMAFGMCSAELAALSQMTMFNVQKRQGVGITGSQLDAVTAVQFRHPTVNFQGICRRKTIQ